MKRTILSTFSALLSVVMVTPAFAYFAVPGNAQADVPDRQSKRSVIRQAEAFNRLPEVIPYAKRSRRESPTEVTTGHRLLRRAEGRLLRRYSRARKPGFDRYRVLNLRTNKRSLRGMEYESNVDLPRALVTTGGYDRPTRRDIRENYYFNRVNNRDRDILEEMRNSSR